MTYRFLKPLLKPLALFVVLNGAPIDPTYASEEANDVCRNSCNTRQESCAKANEDDARGAERCTTYAIECRRHCHEQAMPPQENAQYNNKLQPPSSWPPDPGSKSPQN
jgi:hypothetical protein